MKTSLLQNKYFVLLVLSVFINYGDCIKCYVCDLAVDGSVCDDPFDSSKLSTTTCSMDVYQRKSTTSDLPNVTQLQLYQPSNTSRAVVNFRCGKLKAQENNRRGLGRGCVPDFITCTDLKDMISQLQGISPSNIDCDLCDEDGCNSSVSHKGTIFVVFVAFFVSKFFTGS